jgi:hypothetical protein
MNFFTKLSLVLGIYLLGPCLYASESDPYTYSDVSLEDSADKLNRVLSDHFEVVNLKVIKKLNKEGLSATQLSDEEIEFYYTQAYLQIFIANGIVHVFQECIDKNNCFNWPNFERIKLKKGESVFYKSNYSTLTRGHLASIVNVCGVRMGTDKLTHMFLDGMLFYDAYRDRSFGISLKDIKRYSHKLEGYVMGMAVTKVYSSADVAANMAGVQFFKTLFTGKNPITGRSRKSGLLKLTRKINICEFVDSKLDETVLKNNFFGAGEEEDDDGSDALDVSSGYDRVRKLNSAISQAKKDANWRKRYFSPKDYQKLKKEIFTREVKKEDLILFAPDAVVWAKFTGMISRKHSRALAPYANARNKKARNRRAIEMKVID